jgi:hypothetical protein
VLGIGSIIGAGIVALLGEDARPSGRRSRRRPSLTAHQVMTAFVRTYIRVRDEEAL